MVQSFLAVPCMKTATPVEEESLWEVWCQFGLRLGGGLVQTARDNSKGCVSLAWILKKVFQKRLRGGWRGTARVGKGGCKNCRNLLGHYASALESFLKDFTRNSVLT